METEKLKKLLALAKAGIGGEARNATSILNRELAKLGLNIEDLENENTLALRDFQSRNAFETILLECLLEHHLDDSQLIGISTKDLFGMSVTTIRLTDAQFARIELEFEAHCRALHEEFRLTFTAFLWRQNVKIRTKPSEPRIQTPDQDEFMARVLDRAREMRETEIVAPLPNIKGKQPCT
jgi:hypothetical protein